MSTLSYSYETFTQDADLLFGHWITVRQQEPAAEPIIRRFGLLFVDGVDYPEAEIIEALHRIVLSPWAVSSSSASRSSHFKSALTFNGILNRCFYILINHWWMESTYVEATVPLVKLVKSDPHVPATLVATQKLRELVQQFSQTEEYEALQDRAEIAEAIYEPADTDPEQPLRRLVHRYPFLHPHFLNPWDSSESGFEAIKSRQEQQNRQFEKNLSAYITQMIRHTGQSKTTELSRIKNPTLLTEPQLKHAVKQFLGRSEGKTYKQAAQQARQQIDRTSSCQEMKQALLGYVTSAFQDSSADRPKASPEFKTRLEEQLRVTLWDEQHEKPTGHRLMRTCDEVINCLVANPKDPVHRRFHSIFVSLHSNCGATFTVGLLLKVVLLFQDARDYAERLLRLVAKRFADLLKHYGNERSDDETVKWLVECLENWQVAVSLHFGHIDFSKHAEWVKPL